jgi:ribonuclease HI
LALHMKWHFDSVWSLDGSKNGKTAGSQAAYGAWRGMRPTTHPSWRREYESEIVEAAQWGAVGARLPSCFESDDAECYAVLSAVRQAYEDARAAGQDPSAQNVLILSDCAPIVAQVEKAYRERTSCGLRGTDRGAMLEAICEYRRKLGKVIVFWVPSHEGIGCNAYADAVAKRATRAAPERSLTEGVASMVRSRPCVYERRDTDGEWALFDRPTFKAARLQAKQWVETRLAMGLEAGRITAGCTDFWPDLMARVGKGRRTTKEEEEEGMMGLQPSQAEKRNAHTALTFGLRVGVVQGIRHDALYRRRREAEGNKGGVATRDGAWGCAACMAARLNSTAGEWQQQKRRRARATRLGNGAPASAIVGTNAFASLSVEEPEPQMETVRHVLTECRATAGLRPLADQMAKQCRKVQSDLVGEKAGGQATSFASLATQGWEAVASENPVADEQWRAMNGLAAGGLPVWRSGQGSMLTASSRAANVAARVEGMQELVCERIMAHRNRAAKVTAWIKDRERARPLLRVIMHAWAEHTQKSPRAEDDDAMSEDAHALMEQVAWTKWRAKERPSDRDARRVAEQIKFLRFASLAHAKTSKKSRTIARLARGLRLHLRQRLIAARWRRAGRRVIGRVIIANAKRTHDRERRGTTAIHTAWSSSNVARLPRKTNTNTRVTRPHLTRAAVIGRVAARIMNNYMNLGDG